MRKKYNRSRKIPTLLLSSIVFVTTLSGCDYKLDVTSPWSPKPLFLSGLPQDDSSYSQGVRDGCQMALGSSSVGFVRSYDFSYDPNRGIEDRQYYRGVVIGRNHCMFYTDVDPL